MEIQLYFCEHFNHLHKSCLNSNKARAKISIVETMIPIMFPRADWHQGPVNEEIPVLF